MSNYQDLLEFPEKYHKITWNVRESNLVLTKNKLVDTIANFIKNKNLHEDSNLIVSLSGGVDSMVLTTLLLIVKYKFNYNFDIINTHINYGNREESDDEEEFVRKWCEENNMTFTSKRFGDFKRSNQDRKVYEEFTKNERYDFYKRVIDDYKANGIFLAHHKNDEQENVFTNLLHGRSLIDLSIMKENTVKHGVNIFRPLINYDKKCIYDFSWEFNIPYFKDTTPDWSNRGKLRRQVFPLLRSIYSLEPTLDKIAKESLELNQIIYQTLIKQFIKYSVVIDTTQRYIIINDLSEYRHMPETFWSYIFSSIFHKINLNMISNKSLKVLVYKINNDFNGKVPINKNMMCLLYRDNLKIEFKN